MKSLLKAKKAEQGFGIVEVMISVLVLSLFVLTGASYMAYAAAIRVSSQEKAQISDRINKDIEGIKQVASALDFSASAATTDATACTGSTYGTRFRDAVVGTGTIGAFGTTAAVTSDTINMKLRNSRDGSAAGSETGKAYTITRELTPSGNLLQVKYSAASDESSTTVMTVITEVVPSAALYCN